MTTTELHSGYNTDGKPSSRILRPPGGASSNIFGTDESNPQQQIKQQQREIAKGNQDQNPSEANVKLTTDAQQEYQKNKPKGREHSIPSPFNKCEEKSQNEADFKSYSASAYQEAAMQNAATKERARGQASGSFNPITHEETFNNASTVKDYERANSHPQNVAKQQSQRMLHGQNNVAKAQYNPITGEEYPSDYGQQKPASQGDQLQEDELQEDTAAEDQPKQVKESAPPTVTSQQNQQRVRQPPGGKSSGLW